MYIYIQSWPKRLTHYDFWKIIAFGSKNGFKMGDQCYHMLEEVPLNISRGVQNHRRTWTLFTGGAETFLPRKCRFCPEKTKGTQWKYALFFGSILIELSCSNVYFL